MNILILRLIYRIISFEAIWSRDGYRSVCRRLNLWLFLDWRWRNLGTKQPLFLQAWFDLIKLVSIDYRSYAVSFEINFFCSLEQLAFLYSFISALLFILILITHVWVSLGHMSPECLRLGVLPVADGAHILVLLLHEVLRGASTSFLEGLRLRVMR
jgi:hypothetical protein